MADTKISALTSVTTPALTDQFAVNQGGASKKETLSQIRGGSPLYFAADYGTVGTGAAIQAAMDAAGTAGGGFVMLGPGTWALGSTALTFGFDGITLCGAGKNATFLTYTGTGAAVKNAATTNPEKRYCGMRDLCIDITGASSTPIAFHCFNFYRGIWERLQLKCAVTGGEGVRMEGTNTPALTSTYYNMFRDVDINASGICVHYTGVGPINRNQFQGGLWEGSGKALVHDCTSVTCDTNVFADITITCTSATNVMNLGGSGGAFIYNHFVRLMMETGTSATIAMATGTGAASNNYFFGGIFGSNTIVTQDNMDNHVWIPSQEGLDFMKIAGGASNATTMWLERDTSGITFGSGKDVNLYRGGSNQLKTDDDLFVAGVLVQARFQSGTSSANSWLKWSSNAGTLLTTPEVGALEFDTTNMYGTTDAGNRGIIPIRHFIRAHATRTFTSNTSSQAIFTTPTNGTLTLETGTYRFRGLLAFTGMSSTTGNLLVNMLGAGGATVTAWLWNAVGIDAASAGAGAAYGGTWSVTSASNAVIVPTAINTAMIVQIEGSFELTVAGTIIPSITMGTASATVLSIGSFIEVERIGSTTVTAVGQWT